jgi:hypothetical protein
VNINVKNIFRLFFKQGKGNWVFSVNEVPVVIHRFGVKVSMAQATRLFGIEKIFSARFLNLLPLSHQKGVRVLHQGLGSSEENFFT